MSDVDKGIGHRIKELRISKGVSQQELSELLGIDRVSVSQIENGKRKLTPEEIIKISRFFNIDADMLLNLKKPIKVVIEKSKKKGHIKKSKQDMRISVPQKNMEKFKEVLLYILNKIGSKPNIGETVIYKLLYFIDFNFYEMYEEQLIGATYIKNRYGPTPVEFKKVIEEMEGRDLVVVKDKYFRYPQRKYLPLRRPDLSKLRAHESKLIDNVLEELSDMNAQQISEYSHNDIPWLTAEDGEVIDYEAVFYRTIPYSVRSYSDNAEEDL